MRRPNTEYLPGDTDTSPMTLSQAALRSPAQLVNTSAPGLPAEPNLGILNEVPLSNRVVAKVEAAFIAYLKVRGAIVAILGLSSLWIITQPARSMTDGWIPSVIMLVGLLLFSPVFNWLFMHLGRKLIFAALYGRPAFRVAGGIGRATLRAVLRAAPAVDLTFDSDDAKLLAQVADLDAAITPRLLRRQFATSRKGLESSEETLERDWENAWKRITTAVLPDSGDSLTLDEVRIKYPHAFIMIAPWFVTVAVRTIILDWLAIATLWFSYQWVSGSGSLTPIIVMVLIFGVLTAAWVMTNRPYRAKVMPINFPPRSALLELDLDADLLDKADALRGKILRPTEVRLGRQYFEQLGRVANRVILADSSFRVVTIGVNMCFAVGLALLLVVDRYSLLTTYSSFLAASIGAIALFALTFLLVTSVLAAPKGTTVAIMLAVVTGGIPVLAQFVGITSAAAVGAITVGATIVAKLVENRFQSGQSTR